jgi:arabinan endo-1,5-alpha-L-arabinosidase
MIRLLLCCFFALSCVDSKSLAWEKYRNPVIEANVPDPTVIRAADGYFYLYSTETARQLPIYKSNNLVDWTLVGYAFRPEDRPSFEPNAGIWAPCINYVGGQYLLYYTMSVWDGQTTCGIGVAVSDKPEGPFTDSGELFRSYNIGVQNSIDQVYFEDDGKKYLFWGSWHGIWGIELTDCGLYLKPEAEKRQIAGSAYEAAYIHKRGKYYYLLAATGSCCQGLSSTYNVVVGRSENLWGPYINKSGQAMMDNHHEEILQRSERFVGVGHTSKIITDDKGNDWIFYHGFCTTEPRQRRLFLDKIVWDTDDWLLINDGKPSEESEMPVFDKKINNL